MDQASGIEKAAGETPAASLDREYSRTQCAAANSDPNPVSERTFWPANIARSLFALALESVTDTTQVTIKTVGSRKNVGKSYGKIAGPILSTLVQTVGPMIKRPMEPIMPV